MSTLDSIDEMIKILSK